MDCVSKNCNISGNDHMVACWLCLGVCHIKCSGLRARDADALNDRSKHLQWTCPNCRPIGIEFYNFFKSYKAEFDGLKEGFLALKCKLDEYGELFLKFPKLDDFTISPKPKRKRTSKQSSSSPGISKTSNDPKCQATLQSVSDSNTASSQNNATSLPTNNNPSDINPSPSHPPLQPQASTAPTFNILPDRSTNNQPSELMVFSPLIPSVTHQNDNSPIMNQDNRSTSVAEPKPLRVIPPRKTIFATRFAADTSVIDVEAYIRNTMGRELYNNIQIFKISARNRASFKIIVPDNLFDQIVNPNFWPVNTIVKQFVYRNTDNVVLPNSNNSDPKN